MYKLSKIIKFHLFTPIYQLKHIKSGVDCATNALLSISGRNDLRNKYTHINRCMPSIARNYYGLCKYFSTQKLTKQQIQQSSYSELVNKIINIYNYKQYKIPSALALLQIHHQFQIFKPGHWVLDVGAGPNWAWTDLAIKLTRNYDPSNKGSSLNSNKVISNDLKDMPGSKQSHVHITGDFMQQPTRTNIAVHLLQKQLDTILIDATPQFTGDQESDGRYTMQIFVQVMKFAQKYLKKGGTIIFKTIESSLSLQNQNQAKFYFHQVHRYKSSSFRINSPTFFYILRGFMITQNLKGVQNFLTEYKKAKDAYNKTQIVQKYKQKYTWDPIFLVTNEAKNTVMVMWQQGIKNKQIIKLYENDPYVKIEEIIKLYQVIDNKNTSHIERIKAQNKLLDINNQQIQNLAENQEQFAQAIFENLQKIENQQRQQRRLKEQKKRSKKNKKPTKAKVRKQQKQKAAARAPLAQDEVYMKTTKIKNLDIINEEVRQYKIEDLYGFNPNDPSKSINKTTNKKSQMSKSQQATQQLIKLAKSFPQVQEALGKNQQQLQKQYNQAEQFFRNLAKQDLNKKPDNEILRKIHKINKEKQQSPFFDNQQQNQQEEEDIDLKPKKKLKQKQKQLKKTTQMSSEFDFDQQERQRQKEKQIQDYMNNRGQIYSKQLQRKILNQFNNETKVQYLNSKPKKADRKLNNTAKGNKSYFKLKNKNK